MMNYRLESFRDRDCWVRSERLSLSAHDDSKAVERMQRVDWRRECVGEGRVLVLSRPPGSGWVEVARMGTMRYADET